MRSIPKKVNYLLNGIGIIYVLALAYILFLRSLGADYAWTYPEYLCAMSNFVPLKSIYVLLTTPVISSAIIKRFLLNFVGNIALFIPWGFLLPIHIEKTRKFIKFALMSLATIVLIEAVQIFSMLGSFDIEDILLNMLGASIGFYCWNVLLGKK